MEGIHGQQSHSGSVLMPDIEIGLELKTGESATEYHVALLLSI